MFETWWTYLFFSLDLYMNFDQCNISLGGQTMNICIRHANAIIFFIGDMLNYIPCIIDILSGNTYWNIKQNIPPIQGGTIKLVFS